MSEPSDWYALRDLNGDEAAAALASMVSRYAKNGFIDSKSAERLVKDSDLSRDDFLNEFGVASAYDVDQVTEWVANIVL